MRDRCHLIAQCLFSLAAGPFILAVFGQWVSAQAPAHPASPQHKAAIPAKPTAPVASARISSSNQSWASVYPIAKTFFDLRPDSSSPTAAFAVTNWGLYRTLNEGMTWKAVYSVHAAGLVFAQSLSQPSVLYLGININNGSGYLLKSSDSGQSWNRIGPAEVQHVIRALAVDPKNPNWIYVLTDTVNVVVCEGCQLLASRNGGNSWADVTPQIKTSEYSTGGPCRFLQTNAAKPGSILAGCRRASYETQVHSGESDLLESEDGGQSWRLKDYPGFYTSLQHGEHFVDRENHFWEYIQFHGSGGQGILGINSAVGEHHYHYSGLVLSRDGGSSWSDLTIRLSESAITVPTSVSWSDVDPNRIAFGCAQGTYVSTNGGRSFHKALPFSTVGVAELGSGRLLVATNFGVFSSPDGRSWHESSFGLRSTFGDPEHSTPDSLLSSFDAGEATAVAKIEATDGETLYVGSQGGYWTTGDNGLTWAWHNVQSGLEKVNGTGNEVLPHFHGPNVRQILVADDKTMYLSLAVKGSFWQGGSELLKIQPDGKTVTIRTPIPSTSIAISPSDSNVIYMTGTTLNEGWQVPTGGNQLLKSDDAGFSWQNINLGNWLRSALRGRQVANIQSVILSAQSPKTSLVLLTATLPGYRGEEVAVLRTDDGGSSWKDISPDQISVLSVLDGSFTGQTRTRIGVSPDGRTIYLLTPKAVLRSSDSGAQWAKIPVFANGLNDVAVGSGSPATVYLASSTAGALISKDNGASWVSVPNGSELDRMELILAGPKAVFSEGYGGIYAHFDGPAPTQIQKWRDLDKDVTLDPLGVVSSNEEIAPGERQSTPAGPSAPSRSSSNSGQPGRAQSSGGGIRTALDELGQGQFNEATAELNTALQNGQTVNLSFVEHKALTNSDGVLAVSQDQIVFSSGGKESLRAPFAQLGVRSGAAAMADPNGYYVDLIFEGKRHRFEYHPAGINCSFFNGNNLICEGNGFGQQKAVALWIQNLVNKTNSSGAQN
jgi:photosystem II stability/assembly factor-like uncharacterized protein